MCETMFEEIRLMKDLSKTVRKYLENPNFYTKEDYVEENSLNLQAESVRSMLKNFKANFQDLEMVYDTYISDIYINNYEVQILDLLIKNQIQDKKIVMFYYLIFIINSYENVSDNEIKTMISNHKYLFNMNSLILWFERARINENKLYLQCDDIKRF